MAFTKGKGEGAHVVNFPKPIMPKEHGAWAVLFVPLFAGASIAGVRSPNFILLALSAFCVFMSYVPVQILLRHVFVNPQRGEKLRQAAFWSAVYLLPGISALIPVLTQEYPLLLVIGAVAVAAFLAHFILTRHHPGAISGDLLAVCGLTITAPAAYYVGTGAVDGKALMLWLYSSLFFGSSVFYVHMKIHAATLKRTEMRIADRLSLGKFNLLYHTGVIALLVAMSIYRQSMPFAVLAFVPMALHALYGTFTLSSRVRFKKLGFLLLGQSMMFGVLLWSIVR